MAKHTIMFPDWRRGREPRRIVWDDEAGTVEGDHSQISLIREALDEPIPLVLNDEAATWTIEDPAHDPTDFLTMLSLLVDWQAFDGARLTLPPVFSGLEPALGVVTPCPPGAVQ